MRRLGIIGTMVWDRIYSRDVREEPVEEWGGIAYALAAAAAARPGGWAVEPILKLGRDLEEPGYRLLRAIPGLAAERGVRVVAEPNNRVELRYTSGERRCEQMWGGVPPWSWSELEPIITGLDALYINFISGFELDLATAQQLRASFEGPIYADLHSLLLSIDAAGRRAPRELAEWRAWLACFDAVQVNEAELTALAGRWGGDPWRFAADVVSLDVQLLLVTLGARGAAYVAAPSFAPDPADWRHDGDTVRGSGAARSGRLTVADGGVVGDPTGCGDVWGATCFCALLGGASLEDAIGAANLSAVRNLAHRGATGLHAHLIGRLEA